MILFARHRLNQKVILKWYIETLQAKKLEPVYSEIIWISKKKKKSNFEKSLKYFSF